VLILFSKILTSWITEFLFKTNQWVAKTPNSRSHLLLGDFTQDPKWRTGMGSWMDGQMNMQQK